MKKIEMHWQILIALAAGTLFALYLHPYIGWISWIGVLFLQLLKMVIIPLVMTSIITGVSGIGSAESLGRLGLKTISFYVFTSLLAIILGLSLVNLVQPGIGADLSLAEKVSNIPATEQSIGQLLLAAIPENIFNSLSEGNMLPIIFFAIVFGFYINMVSSRHQNSLNDFFIATYEVMMKITLSIIKLTPLGVFAIIATVTSRYAGDAYALGHVFSRMGIYMLTVIAALLIHTFVTLHLTLWGIGRINPFRHFRNMSTPLLTAFSTSSSSATLPLTMEAVENKDGVSNKIASFTLPLGATINMNGTALYECVAVIFIAQAYGVELTTIQQLIIVFTSLLAAIGSAGIPMAGLVMMTIILKAVGLPLEGIGLILAVDRLLDMFRTTVNVYGDTCAAAIIAKSEGEKLNV